MNETIEQAVQNGQVGLVFSEDEKILMLEMLQNVTFPSAQAKIIAAGIQAKLESQVVG